MTFKKYLFFIVGILLLSLVFDSGAVWAKKKSSAKAKTEASFCLFCSKKKEKKKIKITKKSKSKKKKSAKKHRSKSCPAGVGPMNSHRCDKSLEAKIKKVLGAKHVACYSKLFFVESGCDPKAYHDPVKAHNPHVGVGLCALEKSPALRKKRGRDCQKISTTEQQIKCCASMMRRTPAYYGTVKCKKTPRCS